ncbi:germin-like protein subfamily 1 member 11 [Quercus robur]|uniref:germin-like protein subfamily 1 member 11 n=1 Tax=Quercus robur TaxID=38942 RepID=UPI002162C0E5|nr:germin-like protein subfamily 1 member 11 [Quercus robur]
MIQSVPYLVTLALLALAFRLASAFDPSALQDFCVAVNDSSSGVFVNGKFCKDPNLVKVDDFFAPGLDIPGSTSNPLGSNVTRIAVDNLLGLNTLDISLARIDFARNGVNTPHTHPRSTEVLQVLEGTLYAGFVTSNPNRLFTKILNKGDVIVFPISLIHFELNIGKTDAVALSFFNSQNPGVITTANAVFGSNPLINVDVLAKAFQLDKNVIEYLQKRIWQNSNN